MKKRIKALLTVILTVLTSMALAITAFAMATDNTRAASGSTDSSFTYTQGGAITYADADMTLADVISLADEGSEITFLKDVFIYTPNITTNSSYVNITKGLTFNLNGKTLYFSQSHKNSSFFKVMTTSPITVKNGCAIWNINSDYVANCATNTSQVVEEHASFALFSVNTNNATLNFEDVKAYGANIARSYSNTGTTVNITGGEYHLGYGLDLFGSGLIDFRANTTLNISGALIDLAMSDRQTLFSLTSYKQSSGTVKSTATLTNCTVIGSTATANVLENMNGHTTITFDGCKIYGSINPSSRKEDTCSLPTPVANSVILSGGTLMTADGYLGSDLNVLTVAQDHTVADVSKSYSTAIKTADSTIYGLGANTNAASINTTYKTVSFAASFTLEAKPPLRSFTVTFYKHDGITPFKVMTAIEGETVTPPVYVADGTSNGWYNVGFDGWSKTFGSSNKVTDFTITGNTSFYPAQTEAEGEIVPDLSGAHYNLSFTGSVILNLYLPKAPENVTNVKVSVGEKTVSGRNVITTVDGREHYYKLYKIATLSPAKITESTAVTVSFKINGTSFTKTLTLSPLKYAQSILADSKSASAKWAPETHTMIADMLRYSNELSNAAGLGYSAEISELLDVYGELCTETNARNDFSDYETNMFPLKGYVTSIQFAINDFKPQWIINLDTAKKVTDVSISVDGYYPTASGNVNFGSLTYGTDSTKTVLSGGYVKTAYVESMPVYNMDGDITITVTLSGGSKVEGSYNLSAYYRNMEAVGEDLYSWQKFLEAFRAFATSSSSYKYSEGKISESGPEKDFFECNHENARTKSFNQTNGQYCNTCKTYVFFYDSFIKNLNYGGKIYSSRAEAMSDKTNSYASIHFCHTKANQRSAAGYKSGCVATPGAVYYLGYSTIYNGTVNEITVQTDTQWDGAYIISDESAIDVGDPAFNKPLFCFRGSSTTVNGISYSASGTDVTSHFSSNIKAGATKLPFEPGIPLMLQLTDRSVKHYIRNGANANSGEDQNEVILIDEFGNVSNTTPIEWDYTYSTSVTCTVGCTFKDSNSDGKCDTCTKTKTPVFAVKAYVITDKPTKLSGLGTDENGNATYAIFENITNNSVNATAYKSVGRGITARRSNVTIEGIRHEFTEDDTNLTPRQAYMGFRAWLANDVVFKDMFVEQHMSHYVQDSSGKNTSNLLGSYEFSVDSAINVSWINCKVTNFFNSDGSLDYKGLFGTNGLRNAYLRDCVLTSFDSHSKAGNVTIENSTFEHINFIGAGEIRLNNVTVYQSTGGAAAIILRSDYGSRWRGNVYFDGLELRYDPNNYTTAYIDLIKAYYTNWDFGYGTAAGSNERPQNVYANNVSIMEYSRKASGNSTVIFEEHGQIKENTLKKGTKKLGIYVLLNSHLKNSSYDYSAKSSYNKNPMGCTKNIYITNSDVTIQYPTHKFFNAMNVYVDGLRHSW